MNTNKRYAPEIRERAVRLVLRPIGNTVNLMPPYVITEPDIDLLVAGAHSALDAEVKSGRSSG